MLWKNLTSSFKVTSNTSKKKVNFNCFVFVATFANTSRVDAYTTMTIKVSSITKTSATVSWSGCSGTAKYEVCKGEKVYKNTTKKSMKITGLKKGCTYYTKVNALNKKGNAIGSTKWVKFTTKK